MELEELGPILHHHPALAVVELDYSILLNDALAFSGHEQQLVVKKELSIAAVQDAQSLAHHVPEDKEKKKAENGRRKRKRRKSSSGKTTTAEESEKQRMTHIAVERNRRRVMNEHLTALRSLMPPCYVHKGDQASIVAAAIDYVKQLEQLLQSQLKKKQLLECQQEEEEKEEEDGGEGKKLQGYSCSWRSKSPVADVQVRVVQNHANLKILCVKTSPSQLLDIILAFENLRLTVLHLNVTSSASNQQRQYEYHQSVHYSFSLRIEEDCNMGRRAPEIAEAVHQIFHRLHSFWAREIL